MLDSPPPYSHVANIDEAGDPGIERVRPLDNPGASEWLVLGVTLIEVANEAEPVNWIRSILDDVGSKQRPALHFRDLREWQKPLACQRLATLPVNLFAMTSNKMRTYDEPRHVMCPISSSIQCVAVRGLGSDLDADRASDPTPNNSQSTTLASGAGLETRGDRLRFLDDAPGAVEKFLTFYGRAGSAIGRLEKCGTQLVFQITQATAQRRLPNIERVGGLSKTSVLSGNDCPSQFAKLDG